MRAPLASARRRACWSTTDARSCTCRTAPALPAASAAARRPHDLLASVHPALRLELRTALFQAAQTGQPARTHSIAFEHGGVAHHVRVAVTPVPPLPTPDKALAAEPLLLVRVRRGSETSSSRRGGAAVGSADRQRIAAETRVRSSRSSCRRARPAPTARPRNCTASERGAAGDQRGAALGHRRARDQQGRAAVDERGADHRQPRAQGARSRRPARSTTTCRT